MDTAVLFLTCVVILGIAALRTRRSRAERRAARAERELDLVPGHLGLRDEVPRLDEIVTLVRRGEKIQAIKVYREATGADLVEAEEAVDRLVRR
ncbi:hypothetical protein [Streptomyces griseoloalbus]|uniref:Ribosomal protein L7/L12 n=1 Tax=Streptomyces griseoloalbus TaxID=67303 RepID=A0A7W8BUB0_9ACTN|nr:hypothetical protein [Streptomyces albaduncus]MBB5129759.1 ribosomal protein L7/L12 [Streptomyces albaduncus]